MHTQFYELLNQKKRVTREEGMRGGMRKIMVNTLEMRRHWQEIHFSHYALSQGSSSTGFAVFSPLYIWNNVGSPSHRH